MTVRMDSQLKQNFDALCSRMGMSVNAAINIFANAVVRTRSIPFKISANPMEVEDQALREFREFKNMVAASDRPELTLDEINEEIRLAREERAAKKNVIILFILPNVLRIYAFVSRELTKQTLMSDGRRKIF